MWILENKTTTEYLKISAVVAPYCGGGGGGGGGNGGLYNSIIYDNLSFFQPWCLLTLLLIVEPNEYTYCTA